MTVARLNRGKTKFILGVVTLLVVLGFVAIFQSNQQENDELRESSIRCEQQLGGMQAEKSRSSMEYQKLNADLEKKVNEIETIQTDMEKVQRVLDEERRKFETLEQESKISKTHKEDEIERLKKDNDNLKEQIDFLHKEKDKEIAMLKSKLGFDDDLETVRTLKQQNVRLEQELNRYKAKCDPGFVESSSTAVRKSSPSVETNFNQQVVMVPKPIGGGEPDDGGGVLQQPQLMKSSTTTTTTTEASKGVVKPSDGAPILQAPMLKGSSSTTTANKKIQLPEGVVPFQENSLINNNAEEPAGIIENNRYGNAVEDLAENSKKTGETKSEDINFLNGHDDNDNMANEVPDNDFNIDEKKQKIASHDGVAGDNNAEEDTNLYEANKGIFINPAAKDGSVNKNDGQDLKLKHEVKDDEGKEGDIDYHNEDVHLDAQQEEGGDTDDYDIPNEHPVGEPVVRN